MKKMISLIKTCMSSDMSLFKIKNRSKSRTFKMILPLLLAIFVFYCIYYYAGIVIEPLAKVKLEYILLSLFVFLTFLVTSMEGIYKSSSLLFNCKDDNLLLSLPVKKRTVLFIRIFKFYIFELLYNSLFLAPAMLVYSLNVNVGMTYYIVSFFMLLLLPIIPVFISCIIGMFISFTASKFKFKNIVQIIVTTLFLLVMFYLSYNLESVAKNIATNAKSINEIITKIYYPAGVYAKLITSFNIKDLFIFVILNISLFVVLILLFSKLYFRINSKVKEVKINKSNKKYKLTYNNPFISLIKKELKKFMETPVLVINAGFGLVLFILGVIFISLKLDMVLNFIKNAGINFKISQVYSHMSVVLFLLITFASFMTSITSSLISLEGKSFSILKTIPINPFKIILAKISSAVMIMIPFILIGDIIMFIRFNFSIIQIIMILILSIVLPFIAETFGIIVNLKYPKMDAENDTEIVKQSTSSMVSVFTGLLLVGISVFILIKCILNNISDNIVLLVGVLIHMLIFIMLVIYLKKNGVKDFKKISI